MMQNGPSSIGWFRGLLVVFAIAGMTLFGLACLDAPAPQRAKVASQDIHPKAALGELPQLAPALTRSLVPPMGGATSHEAAPRATERPNHSPLSSWQPPPLPFKFLGKMTEGDDTVVLLYGGGRTLFVRGVGPLDDEYVVEVVQESYLVVRHVSLDQSQVVHFASLDSTLEMAWSAEHTPQD